jgi:outer membrane protein OmpA-like peptidoglycan-associated protein
MGFGNRREASVYRLRAGDTLQAIAERETAAGNPLTWQELARFNWGTDDEAEVNAFLRDELGARQRDADNNFVLAADDRPRGQLLIPRRFRRSGLAAGRRHVLRVKQKRAPRQFLGCCSLPNVVFALESSFIRPAVVEHLKILGMLADSHAEARIMVFGHTDASGDELYNKKLSERRAWSAYAFIVNDAAAWETLYDHPDERWGVPVIQEILADLGHYDGPLDGDLGSGTRDAMRSFLDLPADADVTNDAAFRDRLFRAYMTRKHDVKLGPERFLEPGYMGCGEYNLLHADADQNEANRRVTFFLFHPERLPSLPCAFADTAPCRRQRVSLDHRHSETFTCSFYDSLASRCGCESVRTLRIRLFDPFGQALAGAACTVTVGNHGRHLTADDDGFVELRVAGDHERAIVEWGAHADAAPAPESAPETESAAGRFPYRLEVFLNYDEGDAREELALRRLHNLGYPVDLSAPAEEQTGPVQAFQVHYRERCGLASISGELDEATMAAIAEVHDSCDPEVMTQEG